MDYAGELTTIEDRLGRAGGLDAPRLPSLCPPPPRILSLPILSRSAALLLLLLQDGTVDLELTSSVVGLDPGLAFDTLQIANQERNGDGEIWQLPLAVVAAGCDRLLTMVNCALKVESSYSVGVGARFRQLYLRCVQQACLAEFLACTLGNVNPKQAYVAGLLSGLLGPAEGISPELSSSLNCILSAGLYVQAMNSMHSPAAGGSPVDACVLLAESILDFGGIEGPGLTAKAQHLLDSPLWDCWDSCGRQERCRIVAQGSRLGKWVGANAPRLSPWEFVTRLQRRRSWE